MPELIVFISGHDSPQCWFIDHKTGEITKHIGQVPFPRSGMFAASRWPDIDGQAMLLVNVTPRTNYVVPRDRVTVYEPVS